MDFSQMQALAQQAQQAMQDRQRDALCDIVSKLVRGQVAPSSTQDFWRMVVDAIQREYGITISYSTASHAYAAIREWAIANGGVDERSYLANLFEQRRLDPMWGKYASSVPVPGQSPQVLPATMAPAALSPSSSAAHPLGSFGQMQSALGQSSPPSMGGPATPVAPPGGNTTNTMQLPIRGARRESDAEKEGKK